MRLTADDDVSRLRAVWLGPAGTRWPMDWTYAEWAVAGMTAVPTVVVVAWAVVVSTEDRWEAWLLGSLLGVLLGGVGGLFVKTRIGPLIDPDRPMRHLMKLVWRELARTVWSYGPVDWLAAAVACPLWVAAMALTSGPWLLRALVLVLGAYWLACRVVGRFQSDQRHWARTIARADRSVDPVELDYTITIPDFEVPR